MRKVWIGVMAGAVGGAVLGRLRDSAHHDCEETGHDCGEPGEGESDSGRRPEAAGRVQHTAVQYAF